MKKRNSKKSPNTKLIRIDEDQHKKLSEIAGAQRRSMTGTLYIVLDEFLKKHEEKEQSAA